METEMILNAAIMHYGKKSQMIMFFEELMELYEAINRGERESIIEEIADVSICLKQMFIIFKITNDYLPNDNDFYEVMTNSILFVCRESRGRRERPESLWLLAGWLRTKAQGLDAIDEVKSIARKKIFRLLMRMSND